MMKRLHKLAMYLQFAEMARDLHHKNKKTLQAKLASERSAFDQKLRERDEHAKTQAADAQRRAADERESFDQKLRERDEGAQVMQQKLTQLAVQNEVLQSTLQRLQHDHQNTRRQLEAAQQTIKRTERRARQAEERAQQTQFELREQKACLSKQVAHLEASREESRVRCQDLARRLEHHLDERLASSGDEHFDSLQEFPHNQQIAARYRLVVTELRLDALEWMEEHSAVDSDQIAAWLQLAIQLCFGWVTQHKLAQYEKTLELAFGVARHESKEAVCSDGVTGTEILLPSATATDTADAAAQHALWQCKYEYQPPPAEASLGPRASSTRLRPWLLTLLRHVHKSHTQPHRLLSEAKWIWDEMCRAVLSARQDSKDSKGTVVLWSPQVQDYMTGDILWIALFIFFRVACCLLGDCSGNACPDIDVANANS